MSEGDFQDPDFAEDGQGMQPREELALWLGEFMSATMDADNLYRNHFCNILADRIYEEFGYEGFCEMMMVMDRKAGWISDIILENSDIDDILFKKYGIYDKNAMAKARASESLTEMNSKIWKLRRKYAKQIADELMVVQASGDQAVDPGLPPGNDSPF
jgi:hypothetical protein